jgi:hypothetical protein
MAVEIKKHAKGKKKKHEELSTTPQGVLRNR